MTPDTSYSRPIYVRWVKRYEAWIEKDYGSHIIGFTKVIFGVALPICFLLGAFFTLLGRL